MYCIYGAGGHAKDLLAQLLSDGETTVSALVDDFSPARRVNGIPVVPFETAASRHLDAEWLVALGAPSERRRISRMLSDRGLVEGRMLSPRAFIASDVVLSAAVQVFAGCCLSASVHIGRGVILNFNCSVSHDVSIGDYATISPGCTIAGRVDIRAGAFIGAGATITNGTPGMPLIIGEDATVGAGAVIIRNVEDGDTVAGVPARSLRGD